MSTRRLKCLNWSRVFIATMDAGIRKDFKGNNGNILRYNCKITMKETVMNNLVALCFVQF